MRAHYDARFYDGEDYSSRERYNLEKATWCVDPSRLYVTKLKGLRDVIILQGSMKDLSHVIFAHSDEYFELLHVTWMRYGRQCQTCTKTMFS